MSNLSGRLAKLSPEQREKLLRKLKAQKVKSKTQAEQKIHLQENELNEFPLSPAQHMLWVLDQLVPNSPAYNIPLAFRIRGDFQVDAMKTAVHALVSRHSSLRTVFGVRNGEAHQRVLPSLPDAWSVLDLTEVLEVEREATLRVYTDDEAKRPFNLTTGPLFRATIVNLAPNDHVLMINMHHIISDGRSLEIIMRELVAFYQQEVTGISVELPQLDIQYKDYAVWEQTRHADDFLDTHMAYWEKRLGDNLPVLELPLDKQRPSVQTYNGGRVPFVFDGLLLGRLKKFSQEQNVSLYMTLLAVYNVLLARYSEQDDIIIGSPVANRSQPAVENLIGYFVNMVAIRTDLSENPTFETLLQRVRHEVLDAFSHEALSFNKVAERFAAQSQIGRSPIFQTDFVYQSGGLMLNLPELDTEFIPQHSCTAKFDLSLEMWEENGRLVGFLEYDAELFEAATIEHMIGHYQVILEGVTTAPQTRIGELALLQEAERSLLLQEWNETTLVYAKDKCVHQLFEAQVDRTPDSVAVIYGEESLTYQQLNSRANQVAHYLQKLGVEPDQFVGLCVERSLDMMVGLLGIHKSGAAYLPMDPSYPNDRLAYMLEDTQAFLILTQEKLADSLPDENREGLIFLDTNWETIAKQSTQNPESQIQSNNLAYVIHTSGSTGKPKGVQITHRNVVNFLSSMQEQPGLTEDDRLLAVTTLSFDIAVFEVFLPIVVGATIVVASGEAARDGHVLMTLLEIHDVTVMSVTPATWQLLVDSGWKGSKKLRVLSSGEPLPKQLAGQLLDRVKEVWNMYGPTETTIFSTGYQVMTIEEPILIGRPVANTEIYILDKNLQLVPVGVPGELHIGGDGVSRGYLNRDDLTDERFLPNPFSDDPIDRIYKTGDLARYLPDGNIECLGRLDFQVKVRGFRIELGEIESVLVQHEAVRQGVLTAKEDASGTKILVAYVIMEDGEVLDTTVLRTHLAEQLPHYMIPSIFMDVEEFPLTPNGKVDRRALPDPGVIFTERDTNIVTPRTETEEKLLGIWKEVLNLEEISVHDNFFDLGGHSLLMVRLFTKIEQDTNQKLLLTTLFEAPTIEQLALILDSDLDNSRIGSAWSDIVVTVQPKGDKIPFFHMGGAVLLRPLSKHLGESQPVYGVLEQTLEEDKPLHTSVDSMVSDCVQAIQSVQPEGPYMLGGLCFGGVVALEIARELQTQGHEIALLTLIDTYTIAAIRPVLENGNLKHITLRMRYHWKKSMVNGVIDVPVYFSRKFSSIFREKYNQYMKKLNKTTVQATLKDKQDIYEMNLVARDQYVPSMFEGKGVLFQAGERPDWFEYDPDMGWDGYFSDGVDIYVIPGAHLSIYDEPNVKVFGEKLKICIEEAQSRYKLMVD